MSRFPCGDITRRRQAAITLGPEARQPSLRRRVHLGNTIQEDVHIFRIVFHLLRPSGDGADEVSCSGIFQQDESHAFAAVAGSIFYIVGFAFIQLAVENVPVQIGKEMGRQVFCEMFCFPAEFFSELHQIAR